MIDPKKIEQLARKEIARMEALKALAGTDRTVNLEDVEHYLGIWRAVSRDTGSCGRRWRRSSGNRFWRLSTPNLMILAPTTPIEAQA